MTCFSQVFVSALGTLFSKGHGAGVWTDILRQLGCSLSSLPPLSLLWKRSNRMRTSMRLVGFQGALMDLLAPGDVHPVQVETLAHKNIPRGAKLWSSMTISWKREFSPHQSRPGEAFKKDQSSLKLPHGSTSVHPSDGSPAVQQGSIFSSHIISHQLCPMFDFKVRKIKRRTCSPLLSAQIRDTLEVTEMERSNSLSPTSKAAAFGVKTGTSVKDSEPPESSSTLPPHPREAAGGRRALKKRLAIIGWTNRTWRSLVLKWRFFLLTPKRNIGRVLG